MTKNSKTLRNRLTLLAAISLVAAGIVIWQRTPLLTLYYLHGLTGANDDDRQTWVERIATLDAAAAPGLIDMLRRDDAQACANSQAALMALARRLGLASVGTAALSDDLANGFPCLSDAGRGAVVDWFQGAALELGDKIPQGQPLLQNAAAVLQMAVQIQAKGIRARAMSLAEALLCRGASVNIDLCRSLAVQGLTSPDQEIRARGVRMVIHEPLHSEKAMVDRVTPLLRDNSALVRRAAVLAIGLAEEAISAQDLLPLLQDSDAEVRRLCEAALRGRGLGDTHIAMAKLITDSKASQRIKVVHLLRETSDLDPGIWLNHLSYDPSPAVRAAAIRYGASEPSGADFQRRMQQMAQDDPSPTVRQLAAYYGKVQANR